jgi:hypothetical protein
MGQVCAFEFPDTMHAQYANFSVQVLRSGQLPRFQFVGKVGAEQQSGAKCLLRPRG